MRLLYVFGILFFSFSINAQSVNGVVNDSNGKPLSDVLVRDLVSKTHAHSDINGKFTLENAKIEDSLQI